MSPSKREGQMHEAMEQLMKEKHLKEVIFTNASQEAITLLLSSPK